MSDVDHEMGMLSVLCVYHSVSRWSGIACRMTPDREGREMGFRRYHFVARSSSQQHGAKENVCSPRMETNVGPLCSQYVKNQQKGVSRHYLTPEIVARTIRHHLVAAFYCSANIYDNIFSGTIYENDTYNLYV